MAINKPAQWRRLRLGDAAPALSVRFPQRLHMCAVSPTDVAVGYCAWQVSGPRTPSKGLLCFFVSGWFPAPVPLSWGTRPWLIRRLPRPHPLRTTCTGDSPSLPSRRPAGRQAGNAGLSQDMTDRMGGARKEAAEQTSSVRKDMADQFKDVRSEIRHSISMGYTTILLGLLSVSAVPVAPGLTTPRGRTRIRPIVWQTMGATRSRLRSTTGRNLT
jgi:hypothetical protein